MNYEDDVAVASITAFMDFDVPSVTPGVPGTSQGYRSFTAYFQGFDIIWADPVYVNYGNGGQFMLELSDLHYGTSFWSGPGGEGTVQAIVTNITDSAPVPEPATMMLFGIGLLGLAGVSRRKR